MVEVYKRGPEGDVSLGSIQRGKVSVGREVDLGAVRRRSEAAAKAPVSSSVPSQSGPIHWFGTPRKGKHNRKVRL